MESGGFVWATGVEVLLARAEGLARLGDNGWGLTERGLISTCLCQGSRDEEGWGEGVEETGETHCPLSTDELFK